MDTRRLVIEKAKDLAKDGSYFRFFAVNGEVWECSRSEYLPTTGERAWSAEPIRAHVISIESTGTTNV